MVVGNFKASAELRGRDEHGAKAIELIADVVADPVRALQEHPRARFVAESLAENARGLQRLEGRFIVGRKTVARFDDTLVGAMRGASADTHQSDVIRGRDQIYSHVLRVGRVSDDGQVKVRVHIQDRTRDIDLSGPPDPFVEALRSRRKQRIEVATEWVRDATGMLIQNLRKTRALSTTDFERVSGKESAEAFEGQLDPELAEEFMAQTEAEL